MKIVIAPDTFKECLPASGVAAALGQGALEACQDALIDLCPMADGGDGTVDAMVAATGGRILTADVFGPLGGQVRAHFGLLGVQKEPGLPGELGLAAALGAAEGEGDPLHNRGGTIAVIEMSSASGLALVPPERRDPLRTTTFGTGRLILAAIDAGAGEIIVGIGGSATVDGGCGAAQALGVTFVGRDGQACVCGLAGGDLLGLQAIDMSDRDERIAQTRIRVACDVTNPLTGPDGAAAVYGPQKGATPEMVEQLDAGLKHLAHLIRRDLGVDVEPLPGAGAAGGLGAGLVAFAGARLERGVEIVAAAVALRRRLADADLCITGEGRLDSQSRSGKTAVGVARLAGELGVPVVCIPGQATGDFPRELFRDVRPLVAGEITVPTAMRRPHDLLRERAYQAVMAFLQET